MHCNPSQEVIPQAPAGLVDKPRSSQPGPMVVDASTRRSAGLWAILLAVLLSPAACERSKGEDTRSGSPPPAHRSLHSARVLGALIGSPSTCTASLDAHVKSCSHGVTCKPIEVGDAVKIDIWVENLSQDNATVPANMAAVLSASTKVTVFLACSEFSCASGLYPGILGFDR